MDSHNRFPHEQQAIDKIIAALGQHVEFIQNYFLYDPATNQYLECDLIAVSRDRIAIIELKHWRGEIDVRSYNWVVNGKYRKDPHISNKYKCQVLRSFYEKAFPFLPNLWVESIVVLTNPDAEVQHAHSYKTGQHNPTFDSLDTLIKHYKSRSGVNEFKKLDAGDVKKIANKLRSQAEAPAVKALSIPGYEILENLTQTSSKIEMLVRQSGLDLQKVKRLRVFPVNITASSEERKEQRNKALNSLKALEQVQEYPNVIRVWSVPHEDGHVIEASDWSDEGTLADVIREQAPLSVEKAVTIARGIVEGLRAIHQQGIVHRALSPENILMQGNTPKLMNFELSYIPEDNRITVLPEADSLGNSAYLAPELYDKQDYVKATDLFSVGVILYELLAGETPFRFSLYLKASDGVLKDDALLCLKEHDVPEELQVLLYSLIQADRNERPQDAEQMLKMLEDAVPSEAKIETRPLSNRQLEAGDSHDVYRIVECLGKGREAQVYRAKQGPGVEWEIALKLFNHEIPSKRISNERKTLRRVQSPFIIRWQSVGQWSDLRLFLVFDLIQGESLRQYIDAEIRPDIETFSSVTRSLLEALLAMHSTSEYDEPLLHNDLKPDNILLNAESEPVIIDFGTASEPHLGPYMGTPVYAAPDLSTGIDFQFCESGDLFALGITLFEWLSGNRPYSDTPSLSQKPASIAEYCPDILEKLAQWLDKSVQALKDQRFEDVYQMKAEFDVVCGIETEDSKDKTVTPEEKQESQGENLEQTHFQITEAIEGNPFVNYLNSLHNTTAANDNALAESQALHPLFGSIHIPLELTDYVEEQLTLDNGSHVILTGHAGDGKSTIGLELYKRLKDLSMDEPLARPLGVVEEISCDNEKTVTLVKDMSELSREERNDTVLKTIQEDDGQRWFLISNTGTLLNTLEVVAGEQQINWMELEDQVLNLLEQPDPGVLELGEARFTLINLARIDNIHIAEQLLEKFVAPERWHSCEDCDIHAACPIYCNVKALQEHKSIVKERVGLLYRRLFEYGQRLTVRQMSAHLAYSLTAGLHYHELREMASQAVPYPSEDFLFFNRFFGYCGPKEAPKAKRMTAVQMLLPLEMGAKPFSPLERRLWMNESGSLPQIPDVFQTIQQQLVNKALGGSVEHTVSPSRIRQQIRRMLFMFGELPEDLFDFLPNFLGSQIVQEVESWQYTGKGPNALRLNAIKEQVLHVLQEQYSGLHLPENYGGHELFITMKRGNDEIRQSVQIILAKIPLSHFSLEMQPLNQQLKPQRSVLTLVEKYSQETLVLDVPFLDFVLMRNLGEIGQQLNRAYIDRLERFKAALLDSGKYALDTLELLEMTDDGRFQARKFIFGENTLQVL
ncbi:MAG: protein kinase [bacterium]|nr:protein kinase [bacterium]